VKANQPTLHREIATNFADPAAHATTVEEFDEAHSRIEIRRYTFSREALR
jgi:hypothetical protein